MPSPQFWLIVQSNRKIAVKNAETAEQTWEERSWVVATYKDISTTSVGLLVYDASKQAAAGVGGVQHRTAAAAAADVKD